ncbi:MAG TPA: hypothetical protein EYN73_05600 [Chromatiaceae bacterium]|jgi:hypothetical protein|nr:hypothetical protein [Chromatiaceae bacterium]HIB83959.1 hypothetical protein [Chromatiaceae bacterium]
MLTWLSLFPATASAAPPIGQPQLTRLDLFTPATQGRDLLLDGDIAYVAAGYDGLYILDVSDPPRSHVIAHLNLKEFGLPGYPLYTVTKHSDSVYCGFRTTTGYFDDGYLKVVNVANLLSRGATIKADGLHFNYRDQDLVGRVTGSFMDHANERLYLALRLGGLAVIDVSDPDHLLQLSRYVPSTKYEFQEVVVLSEHNRAYVGGWVSGLLAIDTTNEQAQDWRQLRLQTEGRGTRYWYLATDGQYLYTPVADSPSDNQFNEGLAVYDLAPNLADAKVPPKRIGFAAIPSGEQCESGPRGEQEGQRGSDPGPHQIVLRGHQAWVANGCQGIAEFDISEPAHPRYVTQYKIPTANDSDAKRKTEYPWSLALKGNYLLSVGVSKPRQTGHDLMVFKLDRAMSSP